jgi:hypothetical protein
MKKNNVIDFVIKRLPARWMLYALIVFGLSTGPAMADSDYTRPDNDNIPPTPADLVMVDTLSKTLVIRMLNLTPYTITQDPDYLPADNQNRDRNNHKSMMYAPVGWPKTLPALQGTWTMDEHGFEMFVPDPESNSSVHPLNFVVTWDDQGGYVKNSTIGWTIKDVDDIGHTQTQDVPLRFWFTRIKPETGLHSALFKLVADAIFEFVHLCSIVSDPESPLAWIETFVGAAELADGVDEFNEENSKDTGGPKMYFAAYVVPDNCPKGSTCTPGVVSTDGKGDTTDAVDVQWAYGLGGGDGNYFASNLVVTTLLLRGEDDPAGISAYGFLGGRVPIVSVAIMTTEDYTYAQCASDSTPLASYVSGPELQSMLKTPDKLARYSQFISLYRSLNRKQQKAVKKILRHDNKPKKYQKMLVMKMADAMEKGLTQLPRLTREEKRDMRRQLREQKRNLKKMR